MSSSVRGYSYRDLTAPGRAEIGRTNVSVAKALPLAAGTSNLFTVTGVIVVTGLVGVVSTAASAAISPTIGVGSALAAIAAAPAAGFTGAAGNAIIMPTKLGGQLPAPVSASEAVSSSGLFVVDNAIINITTDVAITGGAITWLLSWAPLWPKNEVATVVND